MQHAEPGGGGKRAALFAVAVVVPALLLVGILAVNAWVVDDAYITFRSVENLADGHGMRWNVDERVQAFTHPLWFFVVAALHAVTSELYLTALSANLVLALAAVAVFAIFVTGRFRHARWRVAFLVLVLVSSKAVIDYASSGLENALSYLLASVFAVALLARDRDPARRLFALVLLASLAYLNRQDTILLYAPALLGWAMANRGSLSRRAWARATLAALPALAWTCFALLYYGAAAPNTSYAKLTATGFPASWRVARGIEYLANNLEWDFPLYGLLLGGIALAIRRRANTLLCLYLGVVAYIAYVVFYAASATHLSGRFFAVPLFLAAGLFVRLLDDRRAAIGIAAALVVFNVVNPAAAIKFGTPAYDSERTLFRAADRSLAGFLKGRSFLDAKNFIYPDYVPLVSNWRPGATYGVDNLWYHGGLEFRASPARVHLGGYEHGEAVGYFGFAAGPEKFVIDRVGLTDPLLARLPAIRPARFSDWKSGHFERIAPLGYEESVAADRNLIRDPQLHAFYDSIRIVTRGPLFARGRLREIWRWNTGFYDSAIEAYYERVVLPEMRRRAAYRSGPRAAKPAATELNSKPNLSQVSRVSSDRSQGRRNSRSPEGGS